MKIQDVKIKVRGRPKKSKLPPKIYEYMIKNLSSLRFDDLVDIMGIDAACKLLDLFSGGYMYIPKKSAVKKDFIHAMIRATAEQLRQEKFKMVEIVKMIASNYPVKEEMIYKILGLKNSDAMNKEKFKKKIQIDNIRDKNLINLLKNNFEKLKAYQLIQ